MSRIPYHFDEKSRYAIERKDEMRKLGLPSPDLFDAICFLFLEDANYMIAESSGTQSNRLADTVLGAAADLFADV